MSALKDVHFRDVEFLYRNWHYPPGWYWYDEEEDLYGPFLSEAHARRGLQLYLMQLMAGQSPTQAGRKKLISDAKH